MPKAGKKLLAKFSTDGTTWNTIKDLNDASMSIEGDNQDISTFGSDFIKRLQGLKDASYSLSGFYNNTTGDGQKEIQEALLNDTELHVQFLPDGVNGFQQEVKVSSMEPSAGVDGTIENSLELEGTDAVTLVSGS